MKKIMLFVVAAIAVTTVGCSYDDSSIWEKFDEVDKRIEQNSQAIESLKDAVANNLSVVDVTQTEEGYILTLSDGSTITLYHGTDGTNGTDGKDGEDGKDGKDGEDGESMISDIDLSDPDYVVITLTDGTTISLARYDSEAPIFNILYEEATAIFEFGSSQEFAVEADNILNYTISKPEGWRVAYQENLLTICSPSKEACCFEKEGTVAVTAVSEAGKSVIATLDVMVGEWVEEVTLRTLTFEDSDARFSPYTLDYASAEINTWSDLIDDVQYGGLLTYANYAEEIYFWQDEANTELCHSFLTPYWGGGHAISNYIIEDYTTLPEGHYGWYELQFSIPIHGHNNSSNFCIHNGYKDSFNTAIYDPTLATIAFMDGQARVVDHMWVTNTCYVLNSLSFGDGFSSPATEETMFYIVATGYDTEGNATGSVTHTLCEGVVMATQWQKFDLTALGKVASISFNFEASDDLKGPYGLNCPAYFAYDDVAVQFTEQVFK